LAIIRLILVIIEDIIIIAVFSDDDYINCNNCGYDYNYNYYDSGYYYSNGSNYCYSDGQLCFTSGTIAWIWIYFVFYTLASILVVINYKRLKDGLEDYHVKKGDHYRHEGF